MVILGVDPGLSQCGYGVLSVKQNNDLQALDWGVIATSAKQPTPQRLHLIFSELQKISKQHGADALAMEQLFFAKNAKSAMAVSEVCGVIILLAAMENISFAEYTPLQIKQTVSSYGRADKLQMQKMIKLLLKLEQIPEPDHAADALAAAVCHAHSAKANAIFGRSSQ
jgi:crossover junction endodeoxyribonuclease RuvC